MLCPKHHHNAKSAKSNICLACGDGGELFCCESCPAAYHSACIDDIVDVTGRPTQEDKWYCHECLGGAKAMDGDIIWYKVRQTAAGRQAGRLGTVFCLNSTCAYVLRVSAHFQNSSQPNLHSMVPTASGLRVCLKRHKRQTLCCRKNLLVGALRVPFESGSTCACFLHLPLFSPTLFSSPPLVRTKTHGAVASLSCDALFFHGCRARCFSAVVQERNLCVITTSTQGFQC